MKLWVILSCVLVSVSANQYKLDMEWKAFKTKFNRAYKSSDEEAFRKNIFIKNKLLIDEHNHLFTRGQFTFTLGINQFADLTNEEFNERYLSIKSKASEYLSDAPFHVNSGNSPEEIDWRDMSCVTNVKDQGSCGASWAFSATGATEAIKCIKTGSYAKLSEQNLIDCSSDEGNNGCVEGNTELAFRYIISKGGIDPENKYLYTGKASTCEYKPLDSEAKLKSYFYIKTDSEVDLADAVIQQPVSVAIDAYHQSFQFYGEGIYDEPECKPTNDVNHAALVVGYGTDSESGKDYWIVKNSYGVDWGDQGYFKMVRNPVALNNCGIAKQALYPTYDVTN